MFKVLCKTTAILGHIWVIVIVITLVLKHYVLLHLIVKGPLLARVVNLHYTLSKVRSLNRTNEKKLKLQSQE
jgi:hypothetical protein